MTILIATQIKSNSKSQILELEFNNGDKKKIAFVKLHSIKYDNNVQSDYSEITSDFIIDKIEPYADYGLSFLFTDGFKSEVFSWEELFKNSH